MRTFLILLLLIGTSLVILDIIAFNGRYIKTTWEAVNEQQQSAMSELGHQIKKSSIHIDGYDR